MMHWDRVLLFYLWIAPHLLLGVIAALLWKRRLHLEFPVFALYVWYEIAEFVVLFTISRTGLNQNWYVRIFPLTLAISAVLRFGVIQEIFNNIFDEDRKLRALTRVCLFWATACLILVAILVSIFAFDRTSNSLIAGAAWVGRGVAIIQGGLVLFLFLFSGLFGVSLQSYVFGIALGFGILSSVQFANSAMRAGELSSFMARALNLLSTGGYHIAVLIWLGYLTVPARKIIQPSDEQVMYDVRNWNNELERFLR